MARSDDYYKRLEEEEKKVRELGGFNYSRQADYDAAWNRLNNREPFKYDLNKDALYKQYKDQYAALGKLAMQDTIGQASAMTGGYGNSYALTAGQQMYNQYMQKPNEMIPTLYGMARDRYDAEGNDLRNQFNLLAADRDYQYGLYNDAYQKALAERDYANTQFNNERSFELQQAAAARAHQPVPRQKRLLLPLRRLTPRRAPNRTPANPRLPLRRSPPPPHLLRVLTSSSHSTALKEATSPRKASTNGRKASPISGPSGPAAPKKASPSPSALR